MYVLCPTNPMCMLVTKSPAIIKPTVTRHLLHLHYRLQAVTSIISTNNNGASFILLNAHHSNNNCIHRLQYYKVRKFQDFQGPSNSDSSSTKPLFKFFQGFEYREKIEDFQGISWMRENPDFGFHESNELVQSYCTPGQAETLDIILESRTYATAAVQLFYTLNAQAASTQRRGNKE